ncbi:MAG: IS3 family transposase, partial [Solirubrobacterales bacterium]|nr:IS3 family transposase [Solirubrobacterales bacterium]
KVRDRFGVEPVCRTLGVSASAYYRRATGQRCARAVRHERLSGRIGEVHRANYGAYGYRRVHKALRRDGVNVGRDQVAALMRRERLAGAKRRGKPWRTTTPDPAAVRRPDLINRQFTVQRPNALWVADLTYLRCWEGTLFFSFVLDAFSRRVVGWQLASHMRTTLVLDALRMALGTRQHGADLQLVHHSDAGSQGGFKRSSQRSIEGSCDGSPQAAEVGSGGAGAVAVAGSAASGTSGASCALLGGDRARVIECGRGGRGRRVGGRWRPMVSRVWRDAAVCDPFVAVGALSVVC